MFGGLRADDVSPARVDAYVSKRLADRSLVTGNPISRATVNNEVTVLKTFLSWLVSRKILHDNPLAKYKMLETVDNRDFHLPEMDVIALLGHACPLCRILLVLAFETGMRRDELRLLEPGEIHWDARVIRLGAQRTKTRKSREIPLSDLALEVLRLAWDRYETARRIHPGVVMPHVFYSEDHPEHAISKTTMWRWLLEARKAAGVRGPRGQAVWWHSLRKSFATILAAEGNASIYALMSMMGQTSKEQHDKYVALTPGHRGQLRAAISARRKESGSEAQILKLVKRNDP